MKTYNEIMDKLSSVIIDVNEIVECHQGYIASDEQYTDPQLWWASPLLDELKKARDNMEYNS